MTASIIVRCSGSCGSKTEVPAQSKAIADRRLKDAGWWIDKGKARCPRCTLQHPKAPEKAKKQARHAV